MSVTLPPVGEHLSLELDASNLEAVRSYIRATYPEMRSEQQGMATQLSFGGAQFTFQNEWDGPCLISSSAEGDALLREIHAHFDQS